MQFVRGALSFFDLRAFLSTFLPLCLGYYQYCKHVNHIKGYQKCGFGRLVVQFQQFIRHQLNPFFEKKLSEGTERVTLLITHC